MWGHTASVLPHRQVNHTFGLCARLCHTEEGKGGDYVSKQVGKVAPTSSDLRTAHPGGQGAAAKGQQPRDMSQCCSNAPRRVQEAREPDGQRFPRSLKGLRRVRSESRDAWTMLHESCGCDHVHRGQHAA